MLNQLSLYSQSGLVKNIIYASIWHICRVALPKNDKDIDNERFCSNRLRNSKPP